MATKIYAVAKGRAVGLYESWGGPNGAQEATSGVAGAKFKAFKTVAEASSYLRECGVASCGVASGGFNITSPSTTSKFFQADSSQPTPGSAPATFAAGSSRAGVPDVPVHDDVDELDGLDDSFLEHVDVDAIVRRHSESAPQRRPRSPVLTGDSNKRQRRSDPSANAATQPYARTFSFMQSDTEIQRRLGAIPDCIRDELMPHQFTGVQFMLKCDGRALLADGMGQCVDTRID